MNYILGFRFFQLNFILKNSSVYSGVHFAGFKFILIKKEPTKPLYEISAAFASSKFLLHHKTTSKLRTMGMGEHYLPLHTLAVVSNTLTLANVIPIKKILYQFTSG